MKSGAKISRNVKTENRVYLRVRLKPLDGLLVVWLGILILYLETWIFSGPSHTVRCAGHSQPDWIQDFANTVFP